ncbi:alpha/beta hydrolase family protein [Gynuella sp.]|uniref:alpha/beta hydrolase family protein n=1 Tax=Gynuella sp. TaxID=2969146 RepID=UPI003D10A18A
MKILTLQDSTQPFDVSVRESTGASIVVIFAVGAGGNPERHHTLLDALAESGCTVVAPYFERLATTTPTQVELTLRARRLSLALDAFSQAGATVAGVGHSIGATTLVALGGGQIWLGPGQPVEITADKRIMRLGLLAPATGFFQAPGALAKVRIPVLAWVGSKDQITPPAQTQWLADTMRDWQTVDVRITNGADHFSFMDQRPPQSVEVLANKQAFLQEHSSELCTFVTS